MKLSYIFLDTSLVLGQPLAAAAAPIPHDSVIPISEASSVESTSFFRRFYHTGTITYATLTESHNTEMNSLVKPFYSNRSKKLDHFTNKNKS